MIDGAVNGAGVTVRGQSGGLRKLQAGSIRAYARGLMIGAVVILGHILCDRCRGKQRRNDVLTTIVFLPLAGALLLLLIENSDGPRDAVIRWTALGASLAVFAATPAPLEPLRPGPRRLPVHRAPRVDPVVRHPVFVGVDGISLFLLVLTGFLTPLALLSSWESVHKKVKEFSAFVLLLEAAMLGVFVSLDLFLFYMFWDAMLVPMYFLIGIGGRAPIYAAGKFILYTAAGSVLMLIAIVGMAWMYNSLTGTGYSFDLLKLYDLRRPVSGRVRFFLAFALAFAIKVPLFPFHTWLPDAHVEAPTAGSVILAGVLLKMGTYGLVRFAFPFFPAAAASSPPRSPSSPSSASSTARWWPWSSRTSRSWWPIVRQPPRLRRARHLRLNVQGIQGAVSRC